MTWNYRLVQLDDSIGVYEVYYDANDQPNLRTLEPANLIGFDGLDDLKEDIKHMLRALDEEILSDEVFK